MKNAKFKLIIAMCIYGTIGLVVRRTSLPSEVLVLARGSIGAVCILLFLLAKKQKPSLKAIKVNFWPLVIGGAVIGLNWVFLFEAYRYTTVAVASLCYYTAPIILVLLSPVLYKERLTAVKLLCFAAAGVGIFFVSGAFGRKVAADELKGIMFGLLAALGYVSAIVCNKKQDNISPYDRTFVQLIVAALVVLPYALVINWGQPIEADAASYMWMLVLALVHTGLAYCLYFGAMTELPVQTVAILSYIDPVVAVLCSAVLLAEPLGITGIIGAVLILGAAVISER